MCSHRLAIGVPRRTLILQGSADGVLQSIDHALSPRPPPVVLTANISDELLVIVHVSSNGSALQFRC